MVTRIGDLAHNRHITDLTQMAQTRMREQQAKVSSQKNAQTYADISQDSTMLVSAKHEKAITGSYIQQNGQALDRLNAMEGALSSISDVVERLRSVVSQRISTSDNTVVPVDLEVDLAISEIASNLNVNLGDRHLFAGSRDDQPPIELPAVINNAADLANIYQGDEITPIHRADEDIEISFEITASDLTFILDGLADLKAAHVANDQAGLMTGFDHITQSIETIAELRGSLGAKANRIENLQSSQIASEDYLGQIVSRIEDTDMAEAISMLARDQTALEASYLAISQINRLSLADYIN